MAKVLVVTDALHESLQEKFKDKTDTGKPDVDPSSCTLNRVFLPDGLLRLSRRGCRAKCSVLRGKTTK